VEADVGSVLNPVSIFQLNCHDTGKHLFHLRVEIKREDNLYFSLAGKNVVVLVLSVGDLDWSEVSVLQGGLHPCVNRGTDEVAFETGNSFGDSIGNLLCFVLYRKVFLFGLRFCLLVHILLHLLGLREFSLINDERHVVVRLRFLTRELWIFICDHFCCVLVKDGTAVGPDAVGDLGLIGGPLHTVGDAVEVIEGLSVLDVFREEVLYELVSW